MKKKRWRIAWGALCVTCAISGIRGLPDDVRRWKEWLRPLFGLELTPVQWMAWAGLCVTMSLALWDQFFDFRGAPRLRQ